MPKSITLHQNESIIAVSHEIFEGAEWSNTPTWVYIRRPDKTIRIDCIRPDERTPELQGLHEIGDALLRALVKAVPVERV